MKNLTHSNVFAAVKSIFNPSGKVPAFFKLSPAHVRIVYVHAEKELGTKPSVSWKHWHARGKIRALLNSAQESYGSAWAEKWKLLCPFQPLGKQK